VRSYAITFRRGEKIYSLVTATLLLTVAGSAMQADSQSQVEREATSSVPLLIQGRVIAIEGILVTVKLPNGYPGGPGIHAQFVRAGPTLKVDVSNARVLLPDGKQADKRPLAVGDQVVMVLSAENAGAAAPPGSLPNVSRTNIAAIIERIVQSDKVITH
jgi:hypothetical protein